MSRLRFGRVSPDVGCSRRCKSVVDGLQFHNGMRFAVAVCGTSEHAGPMAGKAPLLLASVLFIVGAVGLALTSAERAEWGPFEPHVQVAPEQHFVISAADVAFVDPTPLEGLLAVAVQPPAVEQPAAVALVLADPDPEPE